MFLAALEFIAPCTVIALPFFRRITCARAHNHRPYLALDWSINLLLAILKLRDTRESRNTPLRRGPCLSSRFSVKRVFPDSTTRRLNLICFYWGECGVVFVGFLIFLRFFAILLAFFC